MGAEWVVSGKRAGPGQMKLLECYPLLVLLENKALGSGTQEAILQGKSKDGNTANTFPSSEAGRR